ncbi:LOW QUALITY PROTEIN: hypothetical protein PoB_002706800 [Plakobranchus ocellatus]|uniref:Uncharacterized protein n=1 Tax=Plakobranchus ocellatus TaxID=259542 RepID=A0AAV4A099_9GAST|nr:LOW QUALITY PROTEIN: hypothetical protein PoB_002706800 [Plakobranchus ocellatus]
MCTSGAGCEQDYEKHRPTYAPVEQVVNKTTRDITQYLHQWSRMSARLRETSPNMCTSAVGCQQDHERHRPTCAPVKQAVSKAGYERHRSICIHQCSRLSARP